MGSNRECSLPECDDKHFAKGYCSRHYQRLKRTGDPRALVKVYDPTAPRKCSHCGGEGPFHKNGASPDGLMAICKVCKRKMRELHLSTPEGARSAWAVNLRKMGMTPERFEDMADAQSGVCALCSRTNKRRRLVVDHDHSHCGPFIRGTSRSCGECVRGLLCDSCNQMIGKIERIGLDKISDYLVVCDREL